MVNGEAEEDVTRVLQSLNPGSGASEELLPLVYDELRRLAAANMARQPAGQTLQATALVHEAWLRLFNGNARVWQSFHCTNSDGPRRGGDAVADGGTALLGDRIFQQPAALDVLAAAYASAGRFPDAVETAQKAEELAHTFPELARQIQERLNLYRENRPYRETAISK